MKTHWRYFKAVCRHKWFVLLACFSTGVPIWSAILHDWDKYLPDEWRPYAQFFYGGRVQRAKDGTFVRDKNETAFNYAWLLHQKRNQHHWQWWLLYMDDGYTLVFPMSDRARREMLADWIGAGRAYVKNWTPQTTATWYEQNQNKMLLHPETRMWIERQLARREAEYLVEERLKRMGVI